MSRIKNFFLTLIIN